MEYSKVHFNNVENNNEIELTGEVPADKDFGKKFRLKLPNTNGTLITKQEVKDLIKDAGIDGGDEPSIDLDPEKVVLTEGDQTIRGTKKFTDSVTIEYDIEEDNQAVKKEYVDKSISSLNDEIKNLIGNLSDIEIDLDDPDAKLTLVDYLNKIISLIGTGGGNGPSINPDDIDITYTNTEKVPITLGGVTAGTTFNKVKLQDVITMILYPYQSPAITSFTSNMKTSFELGESTPSSITFNWNTSNQKNIRDDKGIVLYWNNKELPSDGLPKAGSKTFTIEPVKLNTQGSITAWIDMFDIKGKKYGKGITFTWLNGIYYGCSESESLDASGIERLTKMSANTVARNYSYPAGGYKYLAYPAAWGEIASTKFVNPANNFVVPMDKMDNVNITNENGVSQDYIVYRSTNLLNGSITITVKS